MVDVEAEEVDDEGDEQPAKRAAASRQARTKGRITPGVARPRLAVAMP